MVIIFSFTNKSPPLHKYASAWSLSKSSKVFQTLNSAVSGEMLQVAFSFQISLKVTYVRHLFNFRCVLQVFIWPMISFSQRVYIALIYTSIELSCGTLIIKIKNLICTCSIVSRVFIYASNKLFCGALIIILWENSICACSCKQIKTSFARNK